MPSVHIYKNIFNLWVNTIPTDYYKVSLKELLLLAPPLVLGLD